VVRIAYHRDEGAIDDLHRNRQHQGRGWTSQKSLIEWWKRRAYSASGLGGNSTICQGVDDPADAVERALSTDAEVLILDGPPAFLTVIEPMIKAADFTVIPVRAAVMDLLASARQQCRAPGRAQRRR
jgi:hypothetical protein